MSQTQESRTERVAISVIMHKQRKDMKIMLASLQVEKHIGDVYISICLGTYIYTYKYVSLL